MADVSKLFSSTEASPWHAVILVGTTTKNKRVDNGVRYSPPTLFDHAVVDIFQVVLSGDQVVVWWNLGISELVIQLLSGRFTLRVVSFSTYSKAFRGDVHLSRISQSEAFCSSRRETFMFPSIVDLFIRQAFGQQLSSAFLWVAYYVYAALFFPNELVFEVELA